MLKTIQITLSFKFISIVQQIIILVYLICSIIQQIIILVYLICSIIQQIIILLDYFLIKITIFISQFPIIKIK